LYTLVMTLPPELQVERLLKENHRLLRENNKLLKKMRRAAIFGFWSKILFYVILIGVPYLIYRYYLQEPFDEIQNTYEELKNNVAELQNLPERLPF